MQKFLRTMLLMALVMVPWATQAQNAAKVSEYDNEVVTAAYATIAGNGGTAWSQGAYVDVAMPFAMQFGESQVASGTNLRVYPDGHAEFVSLAGSQLAPLYLEGGYTTTATSIYTKSNSTGVTVEWRKVVSGSNSYSFQLVLKPSGEIEFHYGPMTISSSINVLVGMMGSATDIYRVGGADGTNDWAGITRYTSGTTTRALSVSYHPAYDATTAQGLVYRFTQPACVKPTSISATATAWNTVHVEWTVSSNGDSYMVKYSTNPDFDPNTEGQSKTSTALNTDVTGLLGGTTYYFAVLKNCSGTYSGPTEKVAVTTPTGCPVLSGIAASAVTASSATLKWSASVAATSYEVRYNFGADFDPEENEGTLVTSTDTTKALTGLTGSSTYYYYVRANCVSNLPTEWYGPYTFNTACGALNVPYTQNFEGYTMPSCWSEDVIAGTDNWSINDGYASFIYTPDASSRLISPVFNLSTTGAYQVEFYHAEPDYSGICDSLSLYYRTSATAEWVILGRYGNHGSTSSLDHEIVALPNPTATYQLAFVSYGMDGNSIFLTGVSVGPEPTCPAPTGIAATSEGVVTWTAGNNNTSYDLVYGPAGFASVEEGTLIENISGTTYTLTGIAGSTSYDVHVRAHCSATNETSEGWVGPASFTTPCMAVALPYTMEFDNSACWTLISNNTVNASSSTSSSNYFGTTTYSNKTVLVFNSWSTASDYFQYAYSPELNTTNVTGNNIRLTIRYSSHGTADPVRFGYTTVANSTNPADYTWTDNFSTSSYDSWQTYEAIIPKTTTNVAIHYASTGCNYKAYIDYVIVDVPPTCYNPSNLAAVPGTGDNATSVTLSWTENSGIPATQWEVLYGPAGCDLEAEGRSVIVNGTPSTVIDYLYVTTSYDWKVRALCSSEDMSDWSDVSTFKTFCPNGGSVTIGTGTSNTSGVIVNSSWGNTYCQQIFTADELIAAGLSAGNIAGMTITWNGNGSYQKDFSIYLGNTTQGNFSSTTAWVPIASQTLVYGPTLRPTTGTAGEQEYTFTTPFTWDGTSNIVVSTFINQHGGNQTGSGFNSYSTNSGMTNMAMWKYRDNSAFTESEVDGLTASSRSGYRASIKLIRPCDSGSCAAPTVAIVPNVDVRGEVALTFTDVNEETNPVFGYKCVLAGVDPSTATGTTTSNTTVTLTGLTQETDYDLYVYAVCSGVAGRMVRYSFYTPFVPDCKTPNLTSAGSGISNITYNTATLTWTQADPQPATWILQYGTDENLDGTPEITLNATTYGFTGLVAGTTYYYRVKSVCTVGIDESPWATGSFTTPECSTPTAVAVSDLTNSTAKISWTENGVATAWTVKYGPAGFELATEGTEVACTADSLELTGLDAYTTYDVYVKANCTTTDESGWSAVMSFTTACPYRDQTVADGSVTYTMVSGTNPDLTLGEHGAIIYDDGGPNGDYSSNQNQYLTIYPATPGNMVHLYDDAYYTEGNTWDYLIVYNGVGTSGDQLGEMRGQVNASTVLDVTSTDPTGALTLYFRSDVSVVKSGWAIAASEIGPCQTNVTCFAPASVSTEITTANVVTVNWAARTDLRPVVNNFELRYGVAGFDPESQGTVVPNLNNVFNYSITSGLEYGTDYDVYVYTVCGSNDYSNPTKASFTTYPSCWAPSALVGTPDENEPKVLLSWTENTTPAATRWQVAYGVAGTVDFEDESTYTLVDATTNSGFELAGLHYHTNYEMAVRANCNVATGDFSDWSNVINVTTACGVWNMADMPLQENFDGFTGTTSSSVASHVLPRCWDYLNGGTSYAGYPVAYNSATYSHSGNNHMRFYEYTTSGYADQYAILPQFDFDLDTVVVGFYARESSTTATYVGNIEVGVMTNPEDASTFEVVGSVLPTTTSYEYFEVNFVDYQGSARYIALRAPKPTTGYNVVYVDDLTVKLREKTNVMADNGGTLTACNEFVMPDTTSGMAYHNNVNATYVINPAEVGKVVALNGSYNLEDGYDFVYVYEGTGANKVLKETLTGKGTLNYKSESNDWVNKGAVTLVFTSDADNAMTYDGFKFLVSCECPEPAADTLKPVVEANGTYAWINGETYTNNYTNASLNADLEEEVFYAQPNVAGCDSVYHLLTLTVHPTYTLTYNAEICERDTFDFFGQQFTATGNYTVTLQTVHGADSTGTLNLQMHEAPSAGIYYNNREVTAVDAFCDNAAMALVARSNNASATFLWEDSSAAANRTVYPHESNTYNVVATDPAYGCTSLPATVTVTTTPVPALTLSGDTVICFGQSATLTLTDTSNVDATYRWNTGATTASITVNPQVTTTYTATATTTNASACAVSASITVVVNPLPVVELATSVSELCLRDSVDLTATAVDGYSYAWSTGANTAATRIAPAATGNYTVTVTDEKGCVDEFTTATVTVHPSYELNDTMAVCYTQNPYTWGAQTLTEDGNYDQTFTIAHGCDSTVHLSFEFRDMATINAYRELCQSTPYVHGGNSYIANADTVLHYVSTPLDCPVDSVLYLTVNMPAASAFERTVCDSTDWNGTTYTESGEFTQVLKTTKGCDSTVTMTLTVNYHTFAERSEVTCDSLQWNAETYYEVGDYVQHFAGADVNGCDSTETLHLTAVNHATTGVDDILWCATRSYTWIDGHTYTLTETSGNVTYKLAELNAQGCDTTAILNLVMNYVTDTSLWVDIDTCDEYVVDTVACDNTVAPAYLRESGDYQLRTHNATTGRDQISRIHLTVTPSTYQTTVVDTCVPYTWIISYVSPESGNDTTYNVGTYNPVAADTVISFDMAEAGITTTGCSDIRVLRLHARRRTVGTEEMILCQNESGETFNHTAISAANYEPGTYNVPLFTTTVNDEGCAYDSTLVLTVNPIYNVEDTLVLCESQFDTNFSYTYVNPANDTETVVLTIDAALNGTVYTNSVIAYWQSATGCDSIVNFFYTVNPTTYETVTEATCDMYTWELNREKYDETITVDYTMVGANQYGCDSIVTLDLTIYDSLVVYDTINVCTTYEGPDGKSYRETMTFREVFDGATAEGCDSIVYTTYNVVQRALIVQNVVTNAPYEWNGTTYTASANNLQWVGATVDGCDSLVVMNLTINDAIEVCEDNLPYTATYGFVLDTDAVSGVYEQHSVISNVVDTLVDTVIYYTINYNVTSSIAETACDSYEWHGNVYTTSGEYTFDTIAATGCDSTTTLTLTVNYNTNSADTVTVCDSYTWNNNGWDTTYTTSGTYTHAYTATNECPSVDTLYLTINVNEPVIATVTACDSYVWTVTNNAANDTLGTYTVTGNYGVEVTDANGCTTTDSLYLTINTYLTGERDSIVNAAFTYYNNTYYEAGTHVDIIDTLVALNGCDSILTTHLTVQIGSIINDSVNGCGVYTWIDGNEYEWIPANQRVNPMFNYKNRTTGASILENPTYSTFVVDPVSGDSVIDETHVLWLNMTEAGFMEQSLGCFYLTPANYTLTVGNDTLGLQDLDLSAYLTDTTNFVLDTMVRHNSTYYCENLVTYHINLIVNNQTALTDTACESYTWFDQTYTASGNYSHTLTGALGCDSVLNLALVVKPAVHNVDVVDNVCDTYTWHDTAYTTSGTYTYSYANANGCTNVDTLKLTLGFSTTATDVQTACDTYTWIDNIVYTASNDSATFTLTNAAGCDSVVTLNLTVNNSIEKDSLIEVLGSSYTLNGVRYTAPYDDFIDVLGQTVAGCDSLVHVHLVLSPYVLTYDNVEACGVYTWSYTGHTYMWISDEESAANSGALYRDITAGEYVYANNLPSDTQNVAVTRLNLTIFEAAFDSATIERFPLSQQTLTLGNNTFDYSAQLAAKTSTTVNEIAHFGSSTMCDSIVFYTINLVYNYDTIEHNVCADSINFMGNTEWNMPNTNQTYWFVETVNAGTADEQVTTHKVYRRAYVTGTDAQTVCDVYDWNGTEYTTSGEYEQTLTDVNGCDSVVTLTLTVNHNTSAGTTVTACDSYTWHDSVYTVSDTYYYSYNTTVGNCPSVDTLYLTINVNEGTNVEETVCDSYTWVANNNTVYTTSGTYYRSFTGTNTCPAIDTLVLTVNQNVHVAQEVWVSEAYRSHGQMLTPGNVYNFIDTVGVTVNGCDSIHDSTIHVGSAFYAAEQVVSCNSYTWRDGNTYVWISDEERAANGNALYKNQTTGEYVLYAPTYTVPQDGNYDSIYALMLTLTQNYVGTDEVTVMVSANTFQYGDTIIDFSAANTRAHDLIGFNDSTIIRDVHFNAVQYCDSVINLTLHVVNNYYGDEDAHICVSNTTFEWRGESYNVATNYYDSLTIDTLYKTSGDSIYYIKVYKHPFVYATERRTACDEYVWNGRTFTESTSNATAILPDQYGCDSTVTLILTILNNSNDTTEAVACGTYDWNTVDGHVFTFTHSVDTVYNYTATNGCPSVDTLHLTINPVYTVTAAETVCDSYVWGDTTITTSGTYTKTFPSVNGCDSTVTLTLTVKTNSNHGDSIVACGEYEWHDSVYTMSDTYFFEYEAANGCASVDTLYLTINPVYTRDVEVCDSLRWGGELYTDAGEYTHTFTTNNVCDSIVTINLMVNHATHNVETVASCLTYTWNNNVYTTSGVKTYEYINDEGCASVDTLHLTIGTGRTFAVQNVTNCGPYTWIVNDSTIDTYAQSIETSTEFVNPATGCDSVVYLNLTIKNAPVVDTTDVICETALPYTWRGNVMTAAGVEEVNFPLDNGCDSTIRFTLTVNPTLTTTVNDNVCLGLGYNANGFEVNAADLAESGVYTFVRTFTSVETGCDSIVTLNLTVGEELTTMTEVTACDSYVWTAGDGNDYTYNETGTYFTEPYTNAQGCKSVDTLRLTINVNSSTAYTASACDSYEWNGTVYDATGIYTYDYTDNNGCASTDTLHLTISSSVTNLNTEVACDSYEWHGTVYTTSGTYVYEYTTNDNCSGTDTLVLTVNNSTSSEETATACDSYTWNGETYTTSGTYTYTTTNAANCDSIVTLNLTIGNSNTGIDEQIACNTYTWIDGNTYTASNNTATYTLVNAAGCDSVVTLNLTVNASTESAETAEACVSYTWNGQTYTQSGVYTFTTTNAAGCDSTVTLTLTVNQPTAGTEIAEACNSYEWNGTNYTQSGVFTFETVNANGCDSTATLVLTIKRPVYATINQTVCGSYTWTDGTGETYTTSGNYTYTATASNGCDSIVTLVLTVNQPIATTVIATACESYTWNNTVYNTTGSYTQTLTAHNGCDSTVTLNLTINQPTTATVAQTACGSYTWNGQTYTTSGTYTYTTTNANGCDSTVTLTLTVNQPMNTTEMQTVCGSYTWNGQTYTTSGTYTNDIIDVNGCSATATLYLTVLQPANSTETITACDNYIWNGQLYTMSGTYTNTFVDVNGCDATATLNLTVNASSTSVENTTVCGSYTWNGQTYTTSGTYSFQTDNAAGCDSTALLNLTVNQPVYTTETMVACDSYTWNGQTYTTSGEYTYTTSAANGCDSIVTLVLTVNNSVTNSIEVTACNSYLWNDVVYTTSGEYTQVLTAHNGCDSAVTMNLTIATSMFVAETVSACDSYEWNGTVYTESGSYTWNGTSVYGCDSTMTLTLTVNHSADTTIFMQGEGSVEWNGETFTESGVYERVLSTVTGCDSVVTLVLSILPEGVPAPYLYNVMDVALMINHNDEGMENVHYIWYRWYRNGELVLEGPDKDSYSEEGRKLNGCYYLEVATDESLEFWVRSNEVCITSEGIDDVAEFDFTIAPNPVLRGSIVNVSVEAGASDLQGAEIRIFDVQGRQIHQQMNNGTIVADFATGMYMVRLSLNDGRTAVRRLIVK